MLTARYPVPTQGEASNALRVLNALAGLKLNVRGAAVSHRTALRIAGDSAALEIDLAKPIPNISALANITDDGSGVMLYNGIPVAASELTPLFQFSETGTAGWHAMPTPTDKFLRYSANRGDTWSGAVRFAAEDALPILSLAYATPQNLTFTLAREFRLAPTGSLTLTCSATADGDERLIVIQSGAAERAITWPSGWIANNYSLSAVPAGRTAFVAVKMIGAQGFYSWELSTA